MKLFGFRTIALASAFCLAIPAFAWAQSEDADAVHAASAAWEAAYNARDIDQIMETYAEDAVSMAPGYPASEGLEAIRADLEALFAEFDPEHSIERKDLLILGDVAVERATYRDVLTPLAGGDATVDEGSHIVVFQRGEDGAWKVLWEIWNSDQSAE